MNLQIIKKIAVVVFCMLLILSSQAQTTNNCTPSTPVFEVKNDGTGYPFNTTDLTLLQTEATRLLSAFPEEYCEKFKVYDYGFSPIIGYTKGGYTAQFDYIKSLHQNEYCLIFARELDENYNLKKIWVDVRLPSDGRFSCLTDMQRSLVSIRVAEATTAVITSGAAFAEMKAMNSLYLQVQKMVDCCWKRGQRDGEGCEEESPCNFLNPPEDENSNVIEILHTTFAENTPSDGVFIGGSLARGNTEDLQYHYEDGTGITDGNNINFPDDALFNSVTGLFNATTFCDAELRQVAIDFLTHFKGSTGTMYYNQMLSKKVSKTPQMKNYIRKFAEKFGEQINSNTTKNSVKPFSFRSNEERPSFSSIFDRFNGLQILINDTEETKIWLTDFRYNANLSYWLADLYIEIYDNFGLDKHDALVYQSKHTGFAHWWILQHQRGYRPFVTLIKIKASIKGYIQP